MIFPVGGLGGEVGVEVVLVGVHRQEREPGVVGLADGAAHGVLVDVPDGEVLVVAADGGLVDGQGRLLFTPS
ncbi:hypothetical protein [Nonomuraea salmonea]|uniref:hypothetical protein n=1 Tax=Nonomuraea salmonea TaxID=46181 RepID=UPI0031E897A2